MKPLRILASGVILSTALVTGASALSTGGTVSASGLNLRTEPKTSAPIVTVAPRNSAVVILAELDDGWYQVYYDGKIGYMSRTYLAAIDTLEADFGNGTIAGSSVRMRSAPDASADILGEYNSGTAVNVTGIENGWYRVSYNGQTGYIRSDLIALTSTSGAVPVGGMSISDMEGNTYSSTKTAKSSVGQAIVDTAMQYLDVPYVWAGTSPSGFDCSGLVYYVYKQHGYSINRTAASIYQNGVYVEKSNLQPGDAICFNNGSGGSIGHVGIYIGDGKFIHASSGAGRVIITNLSDDYYARYYYGARRII